MGEPLREAAHPVADGENRVDREPGAAAVEPGLEVMKERLGLGEAEHAALALECVDAAAQVGGSLARKAMSIKEFALGGHGEMLEFRNAAIAAGDPRGQQFRIGGFTCGCIEPLGRILARADGGDEPVERGGHVVHLSEDDAVGEFSRLEGLAGDRSHALRARVCRELAQEFAKGDEALQIGGVGEDGGLCGGLDRGLEPHVSTPSVWGTAQSDGSEHGRLVARTRIGARAGEVKGLGALGGSSAAIGALARAVNACPPQALRLRGVDGAVPKFKADSVASR